MIYQVLCFNKALFQENLQWGDGSHHQCTHSVDNKKQKNHPGELAGISFM